MIIPQRKIRHDSVDSAGYSWFVRIAKLVLPLAAIIIIGIVFARLSENPAQTTVASLPTEEKTVPGLIELVAARYEGRDAEGRPYTLTADKAQRAMDGTDAILLEGPRADVTLEGGTWIAVQAQAGLFSSAKAHLALKDGVRVFHDAGYEMELQDAAIDLRAQTVISKSPVRAQGPLGEIHGAALDVRNEGALVIFGGPARMTIFNLGKPGGT